MRRQSFSALSCAPSLATAPTAISRAKRRDLSVGKERIMAKGERSVGRSVKDAAVWGPLVLGARAGA